MSLGPLEVPETVSYVLMVKGNDIALAERRLKRYHDITVLNRFANLGALLVESPVASFHTYWRTNVRYTRETVASLLPGQQPRIVYNWKMTGKPVIGKELEDVISSIMINSNI